MFRVVKVALSLLWLLVAIAAAAQSGYLVVDLSQVGTISGTVRWSGAIPRIPAFPIDKDPQVCDPDSHKTRDLDRLIIGPQSGVANTVVFLNDISRGKPLEIPEARRTLDQKQCRYEPHVLLVLQNGPLQLKSSRPLLAFLTAARRPNGSYPAVIEIRSATHGTLAWFE